MTRDTKQQTSTVKNFFAGGFGGICLVAAGHPLDTVKVRMQTMTTVAATATGTGTAAVRPYTGTYDCVRRILAAEGIRGFYKGMAIPLVGVTPLYSVAFFGYSLGLKLQQPAAATGDDATGQNYTAGQIFNAGMLSSVFTNLITTPGERIKCLLQIQSAGPDHRRQFTGPLDCALKLYRDGGLRSLYRGTVATLLRDVPAGGAYFVTYELLKRRLQPADGAGGSLAAATLFAGGMAGIVFWIFALPADVIKSRLQTAPGHLYPNGMRDVIRDIIKREGLGGFYHGATAVFLRAFPANAACFLGYETAMKFIEWIAPDL